MSVSIEQALAIVRQAEQAQLSAPEDARWSLEPLRDHDDAGVRAQALSLLAILTASGRTESSLSQANQLLARAQETLSREVLRGESPGLDVAAWSSLDGAMVWSAARVAHARGYVAFRANDDRLALESLNFAASLYASRGESGSLLRARVLDTLGMLLTRRGDFEGAHGYFSLSVKLKLEDPARGDPSALALTYGNLGRLELLRERFRDAETWLRKDLALILSSAHSPSTEAHVRNQLALAIQGQGSMRHVDVKAELKLARELAPAGSVTAAYVLKNLVTLALDEAKTADAKRYLDELKTLVEQQRYPELEPWIELLEARVLLLESAHSSHDHAISLLERAWLSFVSRSMPQEACEVALVHAQALVKVGEPSRAVAVLNEAHALAEKHLFKQEQPLGRIDAMLKLVGSEGVVSVLQTRFRRMLGGLSEGWFSSEPAASSHARGPKRIEATVWVFDVRGVALSWDTLEPTALIEHLNRLISAAGEAVLAEHGVIAQLSAERVVACFSGKEHVSRAFEASIACAKRIASQRVERALLDEPPWSIAIAMCASWVIEGQIGFSAKVDHGLLGPAVARSVALVTHAPNDSLIVDAITLGLIESMTSCRESTTRLAVTGDIPTNGLAKAFSPFRPRAS
ncbi:MAG: hypothetical protein U0165_10295 [Polyangiaceae bacterium]